MIKLEVNEKGQVLAPQTQRIGKEAFAAQVQCDIYWLGGGGVLLNSCGTIIMLDPVLKGFDMPLLREVPIVPDEVSKLDGVLVTEIGSMQIEVTPVKHNWQNDFPEYAYRNWREEEYCGYLITTGGRKIWLPGDSKLMEEHLHMPAPDVILFDFSQDSWHITLEGAVRLANTYPDSELICIHYGCIDAPDMLPFNGNPEKLFDQVIHPERIRILAPGEKFSLCVK